MPKKGHRTASRQAQLSQKKRRGRVNPQVFDSGPGESSVATAIEDSAVDATAEGGESLQPMKSAVATARPSSTLARQSAQRSRQRTPTESTPAVYRYLGAELKKIGMITTFIVAIIIALTFVLGG